MEKPKIVVAYSGGLDTSVMVKWLKDRYEAEIITYTGNLGQKAELMSIAEKARRTGASKAYIEDLRWEFVRDYVLPALKAGALYEGAYPLATALGRPLLAKHLVEVARKESATTIAHGCTGKGNDQVRFEVSIGALDPSMKAIAPLREWEFKSREEELAFAKANSIPVAVTVEHPYSIDDNLWGVAVECGVLEDPMAEPPADAYQITTAPESAPSTPEYVEIEFEAGIPVALNGVPMDGVQLIETLNEIAGAHGVGRIDLVENRLVGIKSREIYEAPAATVLHAAHRELERITLDRLVFHFKQIVSNEYASLIYNGLWFSPLREAFDSFINKTQEYVTGLVRMKLYKGSVVVVGRTSPYSLYDKSLATYSAEDSFDHKASEGFIKIFGLPLKTISRIRHAEEAIPSQTEEQQ
ncbi:MAG: argininosuccinate synthase [Bacteroidota bacterium]